MGAGFFILHTSSNVSGSSGNVVYYMAKKLGDMYPEPQLSLTMDNYFTNLNLMSALKKHLNITATGTIRLNRVRNNPVDMTFLKDRGDSVSFYSQTVLCI